MIVDDDDDVRLIIQTVLLSKYEVVTAHDGLDALDKLEKYEPDFIIMDIMMPLMDGFQACQAIRKNPKFREMQVLFLSAHGSRENVMESYKSGGNLFLAKPIEPARLLRNVDLYFEKTPPPYRTKHLSMRQIAISENSPNSPISAKNEAPAEKASQSPKSASPGVEKTTAEPTGEKGSSVALIPRILLVEDDKDFASLVALALSESFETIRAVDGLDAIEKLLKYQPDLLIVDIMMPKMNGYQFCQSVRSNRSYANVPIVVLTAKSSAKDREYAMKLGVDAFLAKPAEMQELAECCQALTRRPGFRVHPKQMSVHNINSEISQENNINWEQSENLRRLSRD